MLLLHVQWDQDTESIPVSSLLKYKSEIQIQAEMLTTRFSASFDKCKKGAEADDITKLVAVDCFVVTLVIMRKSVCVVNVSAH